MILVAEVLIIKNKEIKKIKKMKTKLALGDEMKIFKQNKKIFFWTHLE